MCGSLRKGEAANVQKDGLVQQEVDLLCDIFSKSLSSITDLRKTEINRLIKCESSSTSCLVLHDKISFLQQQFICNYRL